MSTIKLGRIVGKDNGPAKGITPTNSLNNTALATKKYVDTSTSNIAGAAGDITRLLEATSALEQRALNMRTSMQPSETGVADFRLFAAEKKQELIEIFGERGNIEIPDVVPEVYWDRHGYTVNSDGHVVDLNNNIILNDQRYTIAADCIIRYASNGQPVVFEIDKPVTPVEPPVVPPVTPDKPPVTPVEPPVDSGTDTDPNENKWTTVGGIEFVDSDGTVTGGTGGNGHDAGHNTTVGKIEFS